MAQTSARRWMSIAVLFLLAVAPQRASAAFYHGVEIPGFLPKKDLPFDPAQLAQVEELEEPVRFEEVQGWRALGGRWAAALDGKGKVIAIYDLSMSTLGPTGPIHLATVGGTGFNLRAVREILANADPLDGKARKARDRALKKIDKHDERSLSADLLPRGWHKRVAWKNRAMAESVEPPSRFGLADIDLRHGCRRSFLLAKALKYLRRFGLAPERFVFERRGDGGYDLLVQPNQGNDRPIRMVDLKCEFAGFFEQLKWAIGQSVVGFLTDLIPEPVVSALVGTAFSRFLTYQNDALWQHRQSANEMVAMALEPATPYSAFSSLTDDELERAGTGLFLSQLSVSPVWNWVFRGPTRAWRDDMKETDSRSASARAWFVAHRIIIHDLNPRFALDEEGGKRRWLYLLSHFRFTQSRTPVDAIDYEQPYRHFMERAAVESASTAVEFGTSFIPWVGGLISTVFDWIVRNPVQGTKENEARLIALLEERERVGGENWERELALLDLQRVNPVEPSRAEARKLIAKHRAELGLPPLPAATRTSLAGY